MKETNTTEKHKKTTPRFQFSHFLHLTFYILHFTSFRNFALEICGFPQKTNICHSPVPCQNLANKGNQRYYIQSAFSIPDQEKKDQEEASLKAIKDAFKRVVILRDDIMPYHDDNGFLIIGLIDFLLNPNSLDL